MAVKTVTLSEDAYDTLLALKREGESFSQVIRRITGAQMLLTPFAGAWADAPDDAIREARRFLKDSDQLSRKKLRQLAQAGVSQG